MRKSFQHQWFRFLDGFPSETLSAIELLRVLLQFLSECPEALSEGPFLAYGLKQFATLRAEDYPIEFTSSSEAEVSHLIAVIKRSKHKKADGIAMLLRDTLEQLLVVESDRNCPQCASGGMGIFKSGFDGRLALMCKHCGNDIYLDGSKREAGALVVATTADLRDPNMRTQYLDAAPRMTPEKVADFLQRINKAGLP